MKLVQNLREMCEYVDDAMDRAVKEIRNAGGVISGSDLDYVDKLTHTLKSIKTVTAMLESGGEDGYSSRYVPRYYYDGEDGMSHARRRDSMGRYSRDSER